MKIKYFIYLSILMLVLLANSPWIKGKVASLSDIELKHLLICQVIAFPILIGFRMRKLSVPIKYSQYLFDLICFAMVYVFIFLLFIGISS